MEYRQESGEMKINENKLRRKVMNETNLSQKYYVRKLNLEDIDKIFHLCSSNSIFYQYHPVKLTKESILEDFYALPPNKEYKDKFFVGYYDDDILVAVMDLILNYPKENIAFIGFFMLDYTYQGQGIASEIIRDCLQYLKLSGYYKVRLAIDKGNLQSQTFWKRNHFSETGEEFLSDMYTYLPMEQISYKRKYIRGFLCLTSK